MKTLAETICGLEICSGELDYCDRCPYKTPEEIKGDQTCDEYEVPLMMSDALYYLKQYKKSLKKDKPLTWDELKQMIGKPIWIEYDNKGIEILSEPKQWVIISFIDNTSVMPEISLVGKWKTFWMQKEFMGMHWNAYRKERHE